MPVLAKASVSHVSLLKRTLKLIHDHWCCTSRPGIIIGKGGQEVDIVEGRVEEDH